MRRYLNIVHSALTDEQERFLAYVQGLEDEVNEDVFDLLYEELVDIRDEFPRMTYSSFLVSWFALVEHELINLCELKDLSINVKIRRQERFGTGIQRAYTFLKEGAGYVIPNKYWEELVNIRKIRNKIVHEDGRIKSHLRKPSFGTNIITVTIGDYDEKRNVFLEIEENLYNYLNQQAMLTIQGPPIYIDPNFEFSLGLVDFGQSLFSIMFEDLGLK